MIKSNSLQTSLLLYVYVIDPEFKTMVLSYPEIDLSAWYNRVPKIVQTVFVSGSQELLVIEADGTCRIFSLTTSTFQ